MQISVVCRSSSWLCFATLFIAAPVFAQQDYVGLFDVYTGFTYFDSPKLNLAERGFHLQAGVNPRTWLALGFDYSTASGYSSLKPSVLNAIAQGQIETQIGPLVSTGVIPAGYALSVPFDSTTETFAAGPQLEFRHWQHVTLFVRPALGAIHETATLHPQDPIAQAVAAQLAPNGQKKDWAGFYGVGGGFDLNPTSHFGIRLQVDFVHTHLFSNLLPPRNMVRLSVGPTFHFGRNIAR
jgi:hypothetical protein